MFISSGCCQNLLTPPGTWHIHVPHMHPSLLLPALSWQQQHEFDDRVIDAFLPACIFTCHHVNQIEPKGDRVLVKVAEQEQKTKGGILLPVAAQKRPTSGQSD